MLDNILFVGVCIVYVIGIGFFAYKISTGNCCPNESINKYVINYNSVN